MALPIDTRKATEALQRARAAVESDAAECLAPSRRHAASSAYTLWIWHHESIVYLEYALDANADSLKSNVAATVAAHLPRVLLSLSHRNRPDVRTPYDTGALADFDFSRVLPLYVALHGKEDVLRICRETNYGQYEGKNKLNTIQSTVCRMIRALYFRDDSWLRTEVVSLDHVAAAPNLPHHIWFHIPKPKRRPLFESLFFGSEAQYETAAQAVCKWYRGTIDRRLTTPEGFIFPEAILNPVLLLTQKIAKCHRGFNVQLNDPFVPEEIICLD